jgi:hypothetical protein
MRITDSIRMNRVRGFIGPAVTAGRVARRPLMRVAVLDESPLVLEVVRASLQLLGIEATCVQSLEDLAGDADWIITDEPVGVPTFRLEKLRGAPDPVQLTAQLRLLVGEASLIGEHRLAQQAAELVIRMGAVAAASR